MQVNCVSVCVAKTDLDNVRLAVRYMEWSLRRARY